MVKDVLIVICIAMVFYWLCFTAGYFFTTGQDMARRFPAVSDEQSEESSAKSNQPK